MSQNRRGVTYKKQARQMIFHVYNFMKSEAEANKLKVTNKSLEQKTAEATKASFSTVQRILSEARKNNNSAKDFVTPGKKRPRTTPLLTNFSPLEQGQIKRLIHNYHVTENEMLTMERLTRKLADTMNYKGSVRSLRRTTLKELGFRFMRVEGGKRLLLEKSEIRYQRIEYLQNLRKYRQEGRNIVYTHHAFLELNHCASLILPKRSVVKTYMGVFTASTESYIPGVTYVFGTSKADYDEHFYLNYQKWIKEHLLPNLSENSVVVISSAKYHNRESDATPNSYSSRTDITNWLTAKNIKFDQDWLKPQLHNLIKAYKAQNKQFLIDKLLIERNHTLLRIPICHPDLSPVEIAWEDIKGYVKSEDMQFTVNNINNAVQAKIGMSVDEFKMVCRRVKDIEQDYRKSDFVIDMLTEEFKFYGGESSDQDDDDIDDEADEVDSEEEEIEVKKERLQ